MKTFVCANKCRYPVSSKPCQLLYTTSKNELSTEFNNSMKLLLENLLLLLYIQV
jgi:hypothetical protein